MKRHHRLTSVVTLLIAALCTTIKPMQASTLAQANCTQPGVQGSYQFLAPATIVVSPGTVIAVPEALLYASPAPYASQGSLVFDSAGNVVLTAVKKLQVKLDPPIHYAGIYTVSTNRTAMATLANGAEFHFKVVENGNGLRLRSLTPGFVIVDEPQ